MSTFADSTLRDSPYQRPAITAALWSAQALIAISLFFAGGSKLIGATEAVALFDAIGVGQWFRYVTGLLEVVGAVALLAPRLILVGVSILSTVMVGAVLTHLLIIGGSPLVVLVHLAVLLAIGWGRYQQQIQRPLADEVVEANR